MATSSIHGIMYQVFKQIDEIIKLMAYIKVQQAKELEVVRANSSENLVINAP